jgi:hypothetical protein
MPIRARYANPSTRRACDEKSRKKLIWLMARSLLPPQRLIVTPYIGIIQIVKMSIASMALTRFVKASVTG